MKVSAERTTGATDELQEEGKRGHRDPRVALEWKNKKALTRPEGPKLRRREAAWEMRVDFWLTNKRSEG